MISCTKNMISYTKNMIFLSRWSHVPRIPCLPRIQPPYQGDLFSQEHDLLIQEYNLFNKMISYRENILFFKHLPHSMHLTSKMSSTYNLIWYQIKNISKVACIKVYHYWYKGGWYSFYAGTPQQISHKNYCISFKYSSTCIASVNISDQSILLLSAVIAAPKWWSCLSKLTIILTVKYWWSRNMNETNFGALSPTPFIFVTSEQKLFLKTKFASSTAPLILLLTTEEILVRH